MLSRVLSASLIGIDAYGVEVEVDIGSKGFPQFSIVGLPDTAVKESKDRVKSALKNIGFNFPLKPITINLAPADLKKEGSAFDLPLAIGILSAEGVISGGAIEDYILLGELSLDGRVKPIRGALSVGLLARKLSKKLIVPRANAPEAAVVEGVEVYGVESLPQAVDIISNRDGVKPFSVDIAREMTENSVYGEDFSDVKGQEHAKRALEVAASGGHNVLMIGPPGSGKTMLSRRLATILPPMTFEEAIETTKIHSIAGLLRGGQAILATRPFRSPHHTISDVALIGGGQVPKPGEVSLAHNGVLFLDELPEFKRNVLEVLRQPLETGEVLVSRASASITYPARFMLVSAMNPCLCGYLGDPRHQCTCSVSQIHRYRKRVSGPLLDRIDIHIDVPAVPYKELSEERTGERSESIRQRVLRARQIQVERFKKEGIFSNGQMRTRHLRKYCQLGEEAKKLLETAIERLSLSARAYARILKVSRTIADMDGEEHILPHHLSEAIQYRTLDRARL